MKIEMDAFNERTANDIELQRSLLSCFENEFASLRNSLTVIDLRSDYQLASSLLHKLKGSVGVFGFVNIAERISELENMPKSDFCADYAGITYKLFSSVEKHIEELKKCIY